jgi:hypothetical protein
VARPHRCRVPSYPWLSIAQIFFRVNHLDFTPPGKRPHLHQSSQCNENTMATTETRANGTATASKTEWYAGATRFELELEVRCGLLYEKKSLLSTNLPPACHSHQAKNNLANPNPVRPIPLKPLLPAPPMRAKVLRGRRLCRMVQVPQILLPARVPPLSLVRVASSLSFPEFHAEKLGSAIVRLTTQRAFIDTLAPLSRRWILCSRSSSVRIFLGRMLLRI